MESNQIKNVIRTFFEKDMSKKTQLLFGRWFGFDEYRSDKDEVMEELWTNSPSIANEQTWDDLAKIETLINNNSKRKHILIKVISYAAAFALIIGSTFYITYKMAVPASSEYIQLSASHGESKKVTLSDGTDVTVNAGSTLIYPEEFTTETRTIFLLGEANFNVEKNPDKPFIVKTKCLNIEALGTKFYVQSYPNTSYTKVTLIEGSIKVDVESDEKNSYILKPNDQLIYSHTTNDVSIVDVDAAKLASWEEGYLIFQGVSFNEIAQTLERKYNVEINYDGKKLNNQAYYVKFSPDESLKEAMDVLTILIDKSHYRIENSKVYFYFN